MPDWLSVGAVARQLKVPPWKLSNLFYRGKLSDETCPIHNGRRMIPPSYVKQIERVLQYQKPYA